jgi:hypothetical protein
MNGLHLYNKWRERTPDLFRGCQWILAGSLMTKRRGVACLQWPRESDARGLLPVFLARLSACCPQPPHAAVVRDGPGALMMWTAGHLTAAYMLQTPQSEPGSTGQHLMSRSRWGLLFAGGQLHDRSNLRMIHCMPPFNLMSACSA